MPHPLMVFSWHSHGIFNTLAGLLALIKHGKSDTTGNGVSSPVEAWDVPNRIEKARRALQLALNNWDVDQTLHVSAEAA